MDIQTLAKWYRQQMETRKRANGDDFWCFKDTADDRCGALAGAAHDNYSISPDDWRYAFIHEALCALEDAEDPDDIHLDPDVYTSELTAWLDSRASRADYCDQAVTDGLLSESATMFDRLSMGQYLEKTEVLYAVRAHLEEEITDLEDSENA